MKKEQLNFSCDIKVGFMALPNDPELNEKNLGQLLKPLHPRVYCVCREL